MSDPLVFEHCGDVMWKLGQKTQALEAWLKARDSGGESSELGRKIETARKKVPLMDSTHLELKRVRAFWKNLGDFSALTQVIVEVGGRSTKTPVRMIYQRNRFLKLEPLQPGVSGFVSLENGHWVNALFDSPDLDRGLHDAVSKMNDLFSAELIDRFLADAHLEVSDVSNRPQAVSEGTRLLLNRHSQVKEVAWLVQDHGVPSAVLTFKDYQQEDPNFPLELIYVQPALHLKLKIRVSRVLKNPFAVTPP